MSATVTAPTATASRRLAVLTGVTLAAAAVGADAAFVALGSAFDYPDVLQHPAQQVLARFHADLAPVVAWFSVLAVSAGLLAPVAVGVARLGGAGARPGAAARALRRSLPVGVAAGLVQLAGLSRWPLLVPGLADRAVAGGPDAADAVRSFETANRVLGQLVGETLGYLLTAAWTLLVVAGLGRAFAGRWFRIGGAVTAVLVLVGVLVPLGVPGADLANFLGYVLWSLWAVGVGVVLARRGPAGTRS